MSWCHIYYIASVILYIYSGYVTASEYYVSAASDEERYPSTDLPCHNLSYYTADYEFFFTNDTIFYFLQGTHILKGTLIISGVSNITLQGQGDIEQGFHETVMQSTSVIRCSDYSRGGIQFTNSRAIVLKSLTIANCGAFFNNSYGEGNVSLLFVDINNVTLEWLSVQNGSCIGLYLYNTFDLLIANSTFTNNGGLNTIAGNAAIFYEDQLKRSSIVNIVKSNFTLSLGYGMALLYFNENDYEVEVIIENNNFLHNTAQYGGGVFIHWENGSGSIEFSNCSIYNNTAWQYGGGVFIELDKGGGSIDFSNCHIYNNTAQQYGGGVFINLYNGGGSIEFSNCHIYNNTVKIGGGMYIFLHNGSGSIEFSNCHIYNNIAQYGGGVHIDLHNKSGSIEFSNCTVYSNTAQIGGGVEIQLDNGSGSIEFSNCTIYNNTAYYGSGMIIIAFPATLTSSIQFSNVLFRYNEVPNKLDKYQSVVLLSNVEKVILNQFEVSNHNTTGLMSINSLIAFEGHNTFVNNSGIYGGGIALYGSLRLLLSQNTNISFVKNHASESGGGIFVSQFLNINITTDCSFGVIPSHNSDDYKTVLYFVNNTANNSGDVLYGGQISDCFNKFDFDHLFSYNPQQTGLSVVSSDPIQVCFCESNRQNCSITNINITAMPGISVNISLATVGIKDGLTNGEIKLTMKLVQ